MKLLCAALVVLGIASLAPAETPTLQTARQRWLHGNYAEAQSQYEALLKDAKAKDAAALGLSRALQSQGEYDKALEAVDAALKDSAKNADLHARRAELLFLRGRWKDADGALDKALTFKKDHFLARWVRAQLYRDRGDTKEADEAFRWFVRTYSDRSNADMDITDPDELLLVALAGAENARWHNLSDQFKVILNDVLGDALKSSKEFWPAEYHAGALLLEKYNRPEALDAFDKALKINPHAAEALVAKGQAALQTYEVRDAERFVERALKINPNLAEALRLRADIALMAGDIKAAFADLEKARKINPRDEATLGRIAACLELQHKKDDLDALVKEVTQHNPKPGAFYAELAERLDERRLFDTAEPFYRKAIELRPMLPAPHNNLGLLLMRMGREAEAGKVLSAAAEADRFNVRVANTLKVLRHLEKYETIKTAHFQLRYDPKLDTVLAKFMADQLETIYDDLAAKFNHKPQGPFLIEVFNNHEMFSGRVIAVPDLHTIGACTGRMFAMVSPRGKGISKPFNWGRVLRHELVHIFNLDQTHFQVPHWLTEGLAVQNEGFPRPPAWNQLLIERVPAGELMNLDDINLGFIRPRSPNDWHLAYCQSELYVEYARSKYGAACIGELLTAYRDGLDTAAAIQKACKVDKGTFEKGYRTHLEELVKGLHGKPPEKTLTYKQLQDAHAKDPDNVDVAAKLAEAFLIRQRKADARKLVDAVLAKKKGHGLASYVKARLLMAAGDDETAIKVLEAGVDPRAPEPKVLVTLGKLYFEAKELQKAADLFELGQKAEPYDNKWLLELVRVYTQIGNKEKLIAVLKQYVPTDADEFVERKRLAGLLLQTDQPAEAERYARQALEIDVLDGDAQNMLIKALAAQKKDAEADRLRKLWEK
jgi:tetratricopeptide (TPR) repeat protein